MTGSIIILFDTYFCFQIKEFLQSYNKITDDCFTQCVYTLSQSRLTGEEVNISIIIDTYGKFVKFNIIITIIVGVVRK